MWPTALGYPERGKLSIAVAARVAPPGAQAARCGIRHSLPLIALAPVAGRGYYRVMARLVRVLAILVLGGLLAAGRPAMAGAANAFDREIMEFVQDHRSHDLDHLMSTLSAQWSKSNFLVAALAITARGDERSFGALGECAKAIAVSEMIVTPLKYATNRKRPEGETSKANSSFPSSHAATAFAAASALGHAYPRIRLPAYAAAALIGYSRVYEQRHFATDVIAGACVGLLSARLSRAHLARLHLDRGRLAAGLPLTIKLEGEGRGVVRIYLSARL